jgi:hypothetical protein
MRKLYPVLIFLLLSLTGCTESYIVAVNGFAEAKNTIPNNARILILVDPNAENTVFESDIRTKIETLLKDRGYQVVDSLAAADYRLDFKYGVKSREETYYDFSGTRIGEHGSYVGPRLYVPHEEIIWDLWLGLKLYRKDTIVWSGEAVTSRRYFDRMKAVDYLLVAAFEYFGQDTGGHKTLTIEAKDPRIVNLASYTK